MDADWCPCGRHTVCRFPSSLLPSNHRLTTFVPSFFQPPGSVTLYCSRSCYELDLEALLGALQECPSSSSDTPSQHRKNLRICEAKCDPFRRLVSPLPDEYVFRDAWVCEKDKRLGILRWANNVATLVSSVPHSGPRSSSSQRHRAPSSQAPRSARNRKSRRPELSTMTPQKFPPRQLFKPIVLASTTRQRLSLDTIFGGTILGRGVYPPILSTVVPIADRRWQAWLMIRVRPFSPLSCAYG